MAKKKVAIVLPGFVRGRDNFEEVDKFIENNSDNYDFYKFISTYDKMGTKTKAYQGGQEETENVSLSTFNNFKYEKILISKYEDIVKYVSNKIEKKLDKLNIILPFDISDKINKIKLHSALCQFHMYQLGLQLVKESEINFDYVIRSRFDLKSNSLDKIVDIEENMISVHFRFDNSMQLLNNTIFKLNYSGVVADTFYYFSYKNLEKVNEITNINFILKCFTSKKLKEELSKIDKTNNGYAAIDTEVISMMIFILNNFNFRNIRSCPVVNRTEKYRKDKEKIINYFEKLNQ